MKYGKTIVPMLSVAALLLTACASDDVTTTALKAEAVNIAVSEVQAVSRAGFVGELDPLFIRATGIGVYAYVTSGTTWTAGGSTRTPNFMLNEHVTFESSQGWVYRPLKYWPNQAADGSNPVDGVGGGTATTPDDIDRVSFFAYAPYVDLDAVAYHDATEAIAAADDPAFTGEGILSLPDDNTTGTPKIAYSIAPRPAFSVDLMYGVAARLYLANENAGSQGANVEEGMPFTDMTKLQADGQLEYRFQHALTSFTAYIDIIDNEDFPTDFANTRVVISNITITGGQLLYKRGVLSLLNTTANTPLWEDIAGPVGDMSDYIATAVKRSNEGTSVSARFAHQPLGVTTTEQSVFGLGVDGRTTAALLFIAGPRTADPVIKVTFHVMKRDASEESGYSDKEVTQSAVLKDVEFLPGHNTVLRMHIDFTESDPVLTVDPTKFTEQW